AVAASFALLVYDPRSVIVSPQAPDAYRDLVGYLQSVEGTVYAPWIGPLESGYQFRPAVHWVPLTDMIRGPKGNMAAHPLTRELLADVLRPEGNAYVLTNYPLENDAALSFLTASYALEADLRTRFAPLTTLPKRYNLGWPRYLYRFVGPSHER
ncbi:MAG: hypothetical protein GX605_09915, partial [Chloroflexi bacterium]|nr:hypothetical protein [Chloroflexota bacterium]